MRGFTSVKYNQQMKHFQIAPQGIGTVQVMPFGNSCTITFPPRQNITLNLAAFFIGFVYKM
jgi:flagellar basal body rod protein FlgF